MTGLRYIVSRLYWCVAKKTRKHAIVKALQLERHPDFAPVNLAYYQHFLGFVSKILRFGKFRLAITNADHVAPCTLSTLNKQVCICGCQAQLPKTQYFRTEKQKMLIICQIDWRKSEWPLSCNAFAIARFLVFFMLLSCRCF